ncbi:hypothetical protein, partial [Acetomicrobium sp. S15 = DSM 107314]|uniref:hypothetical protein n=1 Tax=Acetomicrobium sp. S15 = DSM 107314 TaxID=2529858 RepID=UPI0018E16531
DYQRNMLEGRFPLFLSVEGLDGIGTNVDLLYMLHHYGVRSGLFHEEHVIPALYATLCYDASLCIWLQCAQFPDEAVAPPFVKPIWLAKDAPPSLHLMITKEQLERRFLWE